MYTVNKTTYTFRKSLCDRNFRKVEAWQIGSESGWIYQVADKENADKCCQALNGGDELKAAEYATLGKF